MTITLGHLCRLAVAVSLFRSQTAVSAEEEHDPIQELYEDFFQLLINQDPIFASFVGHHQMDGFLPNKSLPFILAAKDECQSFVERSRDLQNLADLSMHDKFLLQRLEYQAQRCVDSFAYKGYLFGDMDYFHGPPVILYSIIEDPAGFFNVSAPDGLKNVLRRLEQVSSYLRDTEELLRLGVKENLTNHYEQTKALAGMTAHLATPMLALMPHLNSTLFEASLDKDSILEQAGQVITESVVPALRKFSDYLVQEYLPNARPVVGLIGTAGGVQHYEACIQMHVAEDNVTAEEIHKLGLSEMERLQTQLREKASELGFPENLTIKGIFEHARQQPGQAFNSSEQIIDYTNMLFRERIVPKLSEFFEPFLLGEELLQFEIVASRHAPGLGFYRPATKISKATYVQNTNPDKIRKFQLMPVALHEGVPGHHLHLNVYNGLRNMPRFVTLDTMTGSSCPSFIPKFTGFIEGWALYVETLGLEMGLYEQDPMDILGYYSGMLLRTAGNESLVSETGMHAYGWTASEVMIYTIENTGTAGGPSQSRVIRYLSMPGQSVSYKLGERAILRLRRKLEEEEGNEFDIKKFHTRLLSCFGSLSRLEECVRAKSQQQDFTKNED